MIKADNTQKKCFVACDEQTKKDGRCSCLTNTHQSLQLLQAESLAVVFFGNLDKYFEDLQNYEDELYCSNCGNDSKKTFNYIRTVANGEVYCCKRCKTENLVSEKPNEDNY